MAGYVHQCRYCREQQYCPYDDADLAVRAGFAYRIQPKENAQELLRRGLARVPVDLIGTDDYQPAERKLELSQRMLEVRLDGVRTAVSRRSLRRSANGSPHAIGRRIHELCRQYATREQGSPPISPGSRCTLHKRIVCRWPTRCTTLNSVANQPIASGPIRTAA